MFQVRRSVRGLRRRVGHGRDAAHARVPVGVAVRVPGGGGGRGGGVRALQRALLQRVRRAAARAPPAGGCRVPEGPWPGVTVYITRGSVAGALPVGAAADRPAQERRALGRRAGRAVRAVRAVRRLRRLLLVYIDYLTAGNEYFLE